MPKKKMKKFDCEIAILGSGFSGLGAAMALEKRGISDFIIFEKAAKIGGTWRENIYPGAACDVRSIMYSYSYAMNPNWSRAFSPGYEIQAYVEDVAESHGLMGRVRCNYGVSALKWEEGGWTVTTEAGDILRARFIISALGPLHVPVRPDIKGFADFKGTMMHSAEWQTDYDVTDKKIVVIGSAASAVQIVPEIAKKAAHVNVMQRSANWIVPREDKVFAPWQKKLFKHLPFTQRLIRWKFYLFSDLRFSAFRGEHKWLNRIMKRMITRNMEKRIDDPELRKKIIPDYAIGCKRILLSDNYLETLNRNNVSLNTDGIDHINASGISTKSGAQIDADLIVLATGFDPTRMLGNIKVTGLGGVRLEDQWADKIQAYRTVHVANMPNFLMMVGPNSGLGHLSIIFMIEQQATYIAKLIAQMKKRDLKTVSVSRSVEDSYNMELQEALKTTIWHSGCHSWYQDKNGHIFSLWPHRTTTYWWHLKIAKMDALDFE